MDGFTTLNIACLCDAVTGSVSVPTSALPLPITICHCNTCRRGSGNLCATNFRLPEGSSIFKPSGKLSSYNASKDITRFFCPRCGCHVYGELHSRKKISISTGFLDRSDGIVEMKNQIFISDTKDGGLSEWLPEITSWEGWMHTSKEVQSGSKDPLISYSSADALKITKLHGTCHCEGVQFNITRPDERSKQLSSPWSDNLRAYHSHSSENTEDVKWWLSPDNMRYLAGLCACASCRLACGYDIQAWTFVPMANILQTNGKPLDFGMGTLRQYRSSEGVYREFCHSCGATVFWHSDFRPELIDVSVGLLQAESGARAEEWLEWTTKRISFAEHANNKAMILDLGTGLKNWGTRRARP